MTNMYLTDFRWLMVLCFNIVSLTVKLEHLALFYITFQMVIDMHGTHAGRSTGEDYVACLQGEILADVGHYLVDAEDHVGGAAFLHGLSIDIEVEPQGLHIEKLVLADPLADGCGAVEALAEVPGQTLLAQLLLHIAGGEVDTHRHGIIVAMGETLGNVLAQSADAYHQLGLVVYASHEVGNEEGFARLEQRRVGLGEQHWGLCLI